MRRVCQRFQTAGFIIIILFFYILAVNVSGDTFYYYYYYYYCVFKPKLNKFPRDFEKIIMKK